MSKDFILDVAHWDYGELSKLAKKYEKPQLLLNTVYNSGRIDTLKAVTVAAIGGTILYFGVRKWLSKKRKAEMDELLLQQENETAESTDAD